LVVVPAAAMSFGFSISDFIGLGEKAYQVSIVVATALHH
jgi:hypothetical protein